MLDKAAPLVTSSAMFLPHHALQRIAVRDADDWPALACAMTMACPVWTDDADIFGTGVAT